VVHALDRQDDARARRNEARAERVVLLPHKGGEKRDAFRGRPRERTKATRVTTGTTEYSRSASFRVASV
jgi:hypothetical protein